MLFVYRKLNEHWFDSSPAHIFKDINELYNVKKKKFMRYIEFKSDKYAVLTAKSYIEITQRKPG